MNNQKRYNSLRNSFGLFRKSNQKLDKIVGFEQTTPEILKSEKIKEGWILKLGGSGLASNWKHRWCILTSHTMYYFKTNNSEKPCNILHLESYRAIDYISFEELPTKPPRRDEFKFYLKLYNPDNASLRAFYFSVKDKRDGDSWIEKIRYIFTNLSTSAEKVDMQDKSLSVSIIKAKGLPTKGGCNYYSQLELGDVSYKTHTVVKNTSPVWNQKFLFAEVENTDEFLQLDVREEESEVIGRLILPLSSLSNREITTSQWFPLTYPSQSKSCIRGEVRLQIYYDLISLPTQAKLIIKVLETKNLSNFDEGSVKSPVIAIALSSGTGRTREKDSESETEYEFLFPVVDSFLNSEIIVSVWHESSWLASEVFIPLSSISPNTHYDAWYILTKPPSKRKRIKTIRPQKGVEELTDAKDLFRYFLKEQERNLHEEKYVEEETSRKSEEFEEQKEESAILGKVLLKICFFDLRIAPVSEYSELLEIILQDQNLVIIDCLSKISPEKQCLAEALVKIFESSYQSVAFLIRLTQLEIKTLVNPNLIFRTDSFTTYSIEAYLKLTGLNFLKKMISHSLAPILKSTTICEVDSNLVTNFDNYDTYYKNFLQTLETVLKSIFNFFILKDSCPQELKKNFSSMRSELEEKFKFSEHPQVHYLIISRCIFNRFIVPALRDPLGYQLATEIPSKEAMRTLELIAKFLETLGNDDEFSPKSELNVLNDVLVQNKEGMKAFIDELCIPPNTKKKSIALRTSPGNRSSPSLTPRTSFNDSVSEQTRPQLDLELSLVIYLINKSKQEIISSYRSSDNPIMNRFLNVLDRNNKKPSQDDE